LVSLIEIDCVFGEVGVEVLYTKDVHQSLKGYNTKICNFDYSFVGV